MPERSKYVRIFANDTAYEKKSCPGERTTPRRWTQKGFIPFRLEVLTPVFIGSGSDLSPLEYVIRKENDGYALHLVDTESWLMASQNATDISAALDKGDMLQLRRLMDSQLDTALYSLGRIPVPSQATAQGLLNHIHNTASLSNAEVQPFVRNPATMAAIVPGSSLKGALSTPLIDSLDINGGLKAATNSQDKRAYNKKMESLLGNIREHSMQALKVSDIPVPPGGTRLVAAVEVRKMPGKAGTPKTPCETLVPSSFSKLALYGRLFMDTVNGTPQITLRGGSTVSFTQLAELCNAFYSKRFRDEMDRFYRLPHLSAVGQDLQPVLRRIERLNPTREILLRVGHYSHVESVTVTKNDPKSRKGFGKTRTLADREHPFGWVVLTFCDENEYKNGLAQVETAIATATRERELSRTSREKDMRKAQDEVRKRIEATAQAKAKAEEEQKRKEREAAEREAQLAALSPEERAIAEVAASDSTEAQSMTLYASLDNLTEELQSKAATALQTCWQRLGKWEGKQLSKKQKEKVSKVRQLLER